MNHRMLTHSQHISLPYSHFQNIFCIIVGDVCGPLYNHMSESKYFNLFRYRVAARSPNALILASIVSGFTWYFTNQQSNHFAARQQELIGRVQRDETGGDFKTEFDRFKADDWECKKVNLDGVIKPGRFFIKRNRGKQEGYLVLAPFVVSTVNRETYVLSPESYEASNHHRKFVINLGWIPRSRKPLVYTTVGDYLLGEETYQNRQVALQKQQKDGLVRDPLQPEISVPVTNVTAYIRKGESEDKWNGKTNWADVFLYKWINLKELTRVFRIFNEEEGETVYLERTARSEEEPEAIPVPASKETLITDLNNETRNFQNNANRFFWLTSSLSFGIASWITFL